MKLNMKEKEYLIIGILKNRMSLISIVSTVKKAKAYIKSLNHYGSIFVYDFKTGEPLRFDKYKILKRLSKFKYEELK